MDLRYFRSETLNNGSARTSWRYFSFLSYDKPFLLSLLSKTGITLAVVNFLINYRQSLQACNSWRPRLSGGSGAGVEQSASTDQGRLVAVVFSAASVSAVVQLTSDYCTIV